MATTKNDVTLEKHKQRSRKYRARITDLQAKLEAVEATIKSLTSSTAVQGQPDPGKEVPWKFDELLKNSTKYLEDHASLKAAEHASASKMTTASNPYAPLEIRRHSVRTPAAATLGAGPDTPVQIADSPTVQPRAHYHAKLAGRADAPTPRDKKRSPPSKGKDKAGHRHQPATPAVTKGSAPLAEPSTTREQRKNTPSKTGYGSDPEFYSVFYGH